METLTHTLEKQSQAIEKKLEPLQKEHQVLLELIGDAAFYTAEYDAQREEIISKEGTLGKEIAALEEKWLELQNEIEEITGEVDGTSLLASGLGAERAKNERPHE